MGRIIRAIREVFGLPVGDGGSKHAEGELGDSIASNSGQTIDSSTTLEDLKLQKASTTLEDLKLQKGLIIIDDIAINPILDFASYRDAILNIIRNSHPKFTIGIFGDWGSGKTTLMDSVKRELERDKNTITVQFETWRYEREEQFALVPLLKTIAFALPEEPKFKDLKQKLKRGAMNLPKRVPEIISAIVTGYFGTKAGEVTQGMINDFKKEFNSKVELLAEVDRDTLYFDGFEDIRKELKKIIDENHDFRVVVFVDDLDRCSPKKTLEVLESIKVFLGMEGFIYVFGLSHDIVTKLIDIEYEKSGVKGEQYIKKMIQIPITLPKWDNRDISSLITELLDKEMIHERYKETIKQNINLISTSVENSPRELKRFLNNFIVAYEIFSRSKGIEPKELLVIQAIQMRWNDFYDILVKSDTALTVELGKYLGMSDEERTKKLASEDRGDDLNYDIKLKLRDFKPDTEFWEFIKNHSNILLSIHDFTQYRRAAESTRDISESNRPLGEWLLKAKGKLKDYFLIFKTIQKDLDLLHKDLHASGLEDISSEIRDLRLPQKLAIVLHLLKELENLRGEEKQIKQNEILDNIVKIQGEFGRIELSIKNLEPNKRGLNRELYDELLNSSSKVKKHLEDANSILERTDY